MSASPNNSVKLVLDSTEATFQIGHELGLLLQGGDILALTGGLGVGKTVLTRGIARSFGIPSEQVSSPTFILIQRYEGNPSLVHADLYRLEDPTAIFHLGLEDSFTPENIVIIEWADHFLQFFPADYLGIHLDHGNLPTVRHLTMTGTGARGQKIVTMFRRRTESHQITNF